MEAGENNHKGEIERLKKLANSYKEKYEKELRHSQKLDVYTSLAPIAIIDWDSDLKADYWNKAAEYIFGFSHESMVGKLPWDFVLPEEKEEINQEWEKLIREVNSGSYIARFTSCKGIQKICEWRNAAIMHKQKLVGFSSVIIDITSRKIAERELFESNERFKTLSSVTSEAIFLSDKGRVFDANESAIKMFGYSNEEIIKMQAADLFDEESRQIVKSYIDSGYSEPYEIIGVKKNGTKFHVEILGKNYLYKGRNIRVTSVRDITLIKETEQASKKIEKKFKTIFDNVEYGIVVGGKGKRIIDINNSFSNITGYTKDEVVGKTMDFLFSEDMLKKKPLRYDLVDVGDVVLLERELVTKKGRHVPVEVVSKFVDNSFYISIFYDLTDRKKSEKALQLVNLKLQKAKQNYYQLSKLLFSRKSNTDLRGVESQRSLPKKLSAVHHD